MEAATQPRRARSIKGPRPRPAATLFRRTNFSTHFLAVLPLVSPAFRTCVLVSKHSQTTTHATTYAGRLFKMAVGNSFAPGLVLAAMIQSPTLQRCPTHTHARVNAWGFLWALDCRVFHSCHGCVWWLARASLHPHSAHSPGPAAFEARLACKTPLSPPR